VEEIGAIGRGEDMQITSYLEQAVTSELSGNVVDLCPVGALTSKPYAFEARPWELKKTPAIDVMDAVGTNIRLDSRGRQVLRALPRINEDVNEEWASRQDAPPVDGLVRRRLDRPYVRRDGKLVAVSWDEAFDAIKARRSRQRSVAAIAGDLVDCETIFAAKALINHARLDPARGPPDRADYDTSSLAAVNFNTTIAGRRAGRCDPAGRHQFALGSAADQHAHPQGDQKGREGLRDRARDGADLQGRMARRWTWSLLGNLPEAVPTRSPTPRRR
jgi:NADH-quinone oxidoreductase subunit G